MKFLIPTNLWLLSLTTPAKEIGIEISKSHESRKIILWLTGSGSGLNSDNNIDSESSNSDFGAQWFNVLHCFIPHFIGHGIHHGMW